MVYLTALNRHGEIAKKYLLTSVLVVCALFFLGSDFGELTPVLCLSLFEVVIGFWCFKLVRQDKKTMK